MKELSRNHWQDSRTTSDWWSSDAGSALKHSRCKGSVVIIDGKVKSLEKVERLVELVESCLLIEAQSASFEEIHYCTAHGVLNRGLEEDLNSRITQALQEFAVREDGSDDDVLLRRVSSNIE